MRQSPPLGNGSLTVCCECESLSFGPALPISEAVQRLKIDQVDAGMILAGDVRNERGIVLCKKGMALSDTMLRRLKSAGVDTVCVQGQPAATVEELPLAVRIAELHRRFEKTAGEPLMAALRDICERQLVRWYGAAEPGEVEERERDSDEPPAS